ncbi:M20/M25/M40 family metallo-hydrolase [Hymenobacter sp. 15J16-1T3B]|uniref:M20/M25/M40 family metallo-hydrolase n=1 Tax=Hymenobacter sp. 15J16-1T3B TaxID=2886941 RepID=UPI001D10C9AC|nr:M20/M25/M40 family metallo-hydrolase [Hymenobacter sp. 15J16-1T3B]MCC3157016.1 M20/M25/M40 family metallo-hydrolase [Hymenobacter sp. 15J16-1T3B]
MLHHLRSAAAGLLLAAALTVPAQAQTAAKTDSLNLRKIYDEALLRGQSYDNLRYLCQHIGARLSGSPQAEQAVQWGKQTMEKLGFDRVYLQEVMVPHWVRGAKEKASFKAGKGKNQDVAVCALGGSVGTGGKLKAKVVEVRSWDELAKLPADQVKGRFVFFNRAFDDKLIEPGAAYGGAVDQRGRGPVEAAKRGAVGALVRSMTSAKDDFPHTGTTRYDDQVTKVPAAALSTLAADRLSAALKQDKDLEFELEMACQTLPDVKSYNVVGEIKGSKFPDEIITVGGHLDSWDLAQGAHDDGTGCVQSMEALRLLLASGLRPERTVRAVLFMNEENGNRGGTKYAELAKAAGEKHLAAIESDGGGFTPRGFGVEGSPAVVAKLQQWRPLLAPYHAGDIAPGHGGTDIGPLKGQAQALIGYDCDSQRYFDIHHTAADTFDKVHRRELELGGAGMASLIYLLSKYGL